MRCGNASHIIPTSKDPLRQVRNDVMLCLSRMRFLLKLRRNLRWSRVLDWRMALPLTVLLLSACGGSGGNGDALMLPETRPDANVSDGRDTADGGPLAADDVPAGAVERYGSITLRDDAGVASDMIAAFFKLDSGVSADYVEQLFSGQPTQAPRCVVKADDLSGFSDVSAGFVPDIPGAMLAIDAGTSIALDAGGSTYASLVPQTLGVFNYYGQPATESVPAGPVPPDVGVTLAGGMFPAFPRTRFPDVEVLAGLDYGGMSVSASTIFSWVPPTRLGEADTASDSNASLIRIFTSTAGGFFLEDGVTVTCLVADTGSFQFPANIQNRLGSHFVGAPPTVSRLSITTRVENGAVLFVVRESFAD